MWYTEHLLINAREIKASSDQDSDAYNDLLIVEKELEGLISKGMLSANELRVLRAVVESASLTKATKQLGLYQDTVVKVFKTIGDRLSCILGDIFTDEGYLSSLQKKYNLTDEQVETIHNYMTSEYRHKLLDKKFTKRIS